MTTDYDKLKVPELVEEIERRNVDRLEADENAELLSTVGLKADLVAQLEEDDRSDSVSASSSDSGKDVVAEVTENRLPFGETGGRFYYVFRFGGNSEEEHLPAELHNANIGVVRTEALNNGWLFDTEPSDAQIESVDFLPSPKREGGLWSVVYSVSVVPNTQEKLSELQGAGISQAPVPFAAPPAGAAESDEEEGE